MVGWQYTDDEDELIKLYGCFSSRFSTKGKGYVWIPSDSFL
jgi:hypothetical protein